MIDIEDHPHALRPGVGDHLLRDFERVEVRRAVTSANHGEVRNRRRDIDAGRIRDFRIRIRVPLRGVEILRDEDRIVDTDFANDGGAEIADQLDRVACARTRNADRERRPGGARNDTHGFDDQDARGRVTRRKRLVACLRFVVEA